MYGISATSARDTHCPVASSKIGFGKLILVHASAVMSAMAFLTFGSRRTVIDTSAPPLRAACTTSAP